MHAWARNAPLTEEAVPSGLKLSLCLCSDLIRRLRILHRKISPSYIPIRCFASRLFVDTAWIRCMKALADLRRHPVHLLIHSRDRVGHTWFFVVSSFLCRLRRQHVHLLGVLLSDELAWFARKMIKMCPVEHSSGVPLLYCSCDSTRPQIQIHRKYCFSSLFSITCAHSFSNTHKVSSFIHFHVRTRRSMSCILLIIVMRMFKHTRQWRSTWKCRKRDMHFAESSQSSSVKSITSPGSSLIRIDASSVLIFRLEEAPLSSSMRLWMFFCCVYGRQVLDSKNWFQI